MTARVKKVLKKSLFMHYRKHCQTTIISIIIVLFAVLELSEKKLVFQWFTTKKAIHNLKNQTDSLFKSVPYGKPYTFANFSSLHCDLHKSVFLCPLHSEYFSQTKFEIQLPHIHSSIGKSTNVKALQVEYITVMQNFIFLVIWISYIYTS